MTDAFAFTTRPAASDDRPFLELMLLEAVNWLPGRSITPDRLRATPELAHYISGWPRSTDVGVVAEMPERRPIGAVWLRTFPADDPGFGFVGPDVPELSIGVLAEHRGRGVGRALLREIAREAGARGVTTMCLSVECRNPALLLYRSEGWRVVRSDGNAAVLCRPTSGPADATGR